MHASLAGWVARWLGGWLAGWAFGDVVRHRSLPLTSDLIAKQPEVQGDRLEVSQVLAGAASHDCQHIAAVPDVCLVLLQVQIHRSSSNDSMACQGVHPPGGGRCLCPPPCTAAGSSLRVTDPPCGVQLLDAPAKDVLVDGDAHGPLQGARPPCAAAAGAWPATLAAVWCVPRLTNYRVVHQGRRGPLRRGMHRLWTGQKLLDRGGLKLRQTLSLGDSN